jgi:hypothetical protein
MSLSVHRQHAAFPLRFTFDSAAALLGKIAHRGRSDMDRVEHQPQRHLQSAKDSSLIATIAEVSMRGTGVEK